MVIKETDLIFFFPHVWLPVIFFFFFNKYVPNLPWGMQPDQCPGEYSKSQQVREAEVSWFSHHVLEGASEKMDSLSHVGTSCWVSLSTWHNWKFHSSVCFYPLWLPMVSVSPAHPSELPPAAFLVCVRPPGGLCLGNTQLRLPDKNTTG